MFDFVASIFNLNPRIGFVLEDTVWFNFELVYEDYLVVNLQEVRAKDQVAKVDTRLKTTHFSFGKKWPK